MLVVDFLEDAREFEIRHMRIDFLGTSLDIISILINDI